MSFVIHKDPLVIFLQFRLSQTSYLVNDVWRVIWVSVVSEIWKHRNFVIFDMGVVDVLEVFVLVQVNVGSWIYAKSRGAPFTYFNWNFEPRDLYEVDCLMFSKCLV